MLLFVLKRLALMVPQVFAAVVGTFVLLRVLPVDPTSRIVGSFATVQARAQARAELGLDKALPDQLLQYLEGLAHGNLGTSWYTGDPISAEIARYFPVTIQLTVMAFILALAIAIPVGRSAAARPGGLVDRITMGYGLFGGAQPDFWWGLMFIFLLYFEAKLFPAPLGLLSPSTIPPVPHTQFLLIDAIIDGDTSAFVDGLWHYGLPVLTLAFVLTGPLVKMTRQSMLAVVNSDYILYARVSGLGKQTIRWYMLRNGIAPTVTLAGILFGFLLGGAVLTETVFSLPGLGVYSLQRTLSTDFPAIQGAVLVMTTFSLLIYLCLDIAYALLDPRVRVGGGY